MVISASVSVTGAAEMFNAQTKNPAAHAKERRRLAGLPFMGRFSDHLPLFINTQFSTRCIFHSFEAATKNL
jgi:hypothetical protein